MKHSPAPWKEEETEDGDVFVVMDDAHKVFIGNLEGTCGICHANARLIAAAPELLEALENLCRELDRQNDPQWIGSPMEKSSRSAISKATLPDSSSIDFEKLP